ncbi:MAG: ABC transporter substrate-binding protein, partial [Oricola sp.]|nr:ABC transporter substrate-binding protein [Oricola sp.]
RNSSRKRPLKLSQYPFAPLGSGWHRMIEVFEEEFNKAGGVNLADCGKKVPIEILIYDDQSNPTTAVGLFERMASQDSVDFFVGPDWSSLGLAVSAVAERHAIPIVMGNVAAPSAYRHGQENVFGTPSPIVPLWSERYFEMLETVDPKPESFFFIIQDNPVTAAISDFWM